MLLNLLVIHFAFGSPFGVYQITRGGSVRSTRSAAKVAAHFVLWPIFAAAFIRSWLINNLKPAESHLEQKIANIRSKIEDAAFSGSSTMPVFEFRDVFARFTGLTMALLHGGKVSSSREMLKIVGHKNISLASACINRRNRQRLLFHQKQAQLEFNELISALAERSNNNDMGDLALSLTKLLDEGA